jgi:hypothetical protein
VKLVRLCQLIGAILFALAVLTSAPVAGAAPSSSAATPAPTAPASPTSGVTRTFTVSVSPAQASGGAATIFTIAVANTSLDPRVNLARVDLIAPAGFTPTSASLSPGTFGFASVAGRVVALRWLRVAPGGILNVAVRATAPCMAGSYRWRAAARTEGRFYSHGLPVTLDTAASQLATSVTTRCALRFATEPADTVVGAPITGTSFTPAGPPVAVAIVDGSGSPIFTSGAAITISLGANPGGATLAGPMTALTLNGVATFPGLTLDRPGDGYTLTAGGAGAAPAVSTPFDEVTDAARCPSGQTCQVTATTAVSSLTVTAQGGSTVGTVSVSVDVGRPLQCAGFDAPDPNWFQFVSTDTPAGKLITYRLRRPGGRDTGGSARQFCFGARYEFTSVDGQPAPPATLPDGTLGFAGQLPNCRRGGSGPCIVARRQTHDRSSPTCRDIVLDVFVPGALPGDPYGRG